MKVLIATGGTGGHINPAIDLAEAIYADDNKNEVIFFGSNDRLESQMIPEKGYRFFGYDFVVPEGSFLEKIKAVISILKAKKYCRALLNQEKVDVVIGFGNYITIPMIMEAKRKGIPTVIHEQNSFAGKANLYLKKYADLIVGSYPSNKEQFNSNNFQLLGNPSSTKAKDVTWDKNELTKFGLSPDKPFVLVMMGSLGSKSVSKIMDEACSLLDDTFQVIIVNGSLNDYAYEFKENENIKIVQYVDGKKLLKGCDIAVLRAGATTIAEITAIGVASVIIPSPYVVNNHQYYNAKELEDNHACILLNEKELNAQILADTINSLMKDVNKKEELKKNILALGYPNAAQDMIKYVKGLLKNG